MNENVFSKKLITLRKTHHMTQQDLADLLCISNKTVSRWETNESYPDIELLPKIADIFHVSIDYLLKDHDDFKELDKMDIVSYLPWIISLCGVLVYYVFTALSISSLFSFMIYYFIIGFSYQFLKKYTDRKNGIKLVELNTVANFFVIQSLTSKFFIIVSIMNLTSEIFIVEEYNFDMMQNTTQFMGPIMLSYVVAAICAFVHYKGHMNDEYCLHTKS